MTTANPGSNAAQLNLDAQLDGASPRARRLLREARKAIEQRDAVGADQFLERAQTLVEAHPEYLRLIGISRPIQQRNDEARSAFRQALELRPADPVILTNSARLCAIRTRSTRRRAFRMSRARQGPALHA